MCSHMPSQCALVIAAVGAGGPFGRLLEVVAEVPETAVTSGADTDSAALSIARPGCLYQHSSPCIQ